MDDRQRYFIAYKRYIDGGLYKMCDAVMSVCADNPEWAIKFIVRGIKDGLPVPHVAKKEVEKARQYIGIN